jgi:hypothetical protein
VSGTSSSSSFVLTYDGFSWSREVTPMQRRVVSISSDSTAQAQWLALECLLLSTSTARTEEQ